MRATTGGQGKRPRPVHVAALRRADKIEKARRGKLSPRQQHLVKLARRTVTAKPHQQKRIAQAFEHLNLTEGEKRLINRAATQHGEHLRKMQPGFREEIVRPAQKALKTVGLGGAAHPIRRLRHPGGRMEFPGFGRFFPEIKAAGIPKRAKAAETPKPRAARPEATAKVHEALRGGVEHTVARPRTRQEAEKFVAETDAKYEKMIRAMSSGEVKPKGVVVKRNARNAKLLRRGAASRIKPTLTAEARQHAENQLRKLMETSTHPSVVRMKGQLAEADRLREELAASHDPLLGHGGPAELGTVADKTVRSKSWSALHREQRAGYRTERGRRAAAAEAAMQKGGVEGYHAALHELKGKLPRVEFHGLRGLSEDEADSLFTHVQSHPELRTYDKIRAQAALRNAWLEGTLPTPSERKLLEKAFGPELGGHLFHPSRLERIKHVAIETANIPRSIMASFDVSAPFRQGLVAFTRHPVLSGRNLKPMFRVLGSEKGYQALMEDIRSRPTFPEMERSGLAITDMEHALGGREEAFQSNYAERIPGIGRGVRGSGRAYTGFLVKTRADMFDHLVHTAEQQGIDLGEKGMKDLARYINAATGRGHLGQFERSAVGLNSIFFSPRLIASRLDFLNPAKYAGLDPFVRQQKIRAAVQFVGAMGAVLWLASRVPGVKVQMDPRSSDFGKIRIGNTRLDVAGGFSQYIRILAQVTSNEKIDPNTGKVLHGQGLDSLVRFIRGKLSPTSSVAADLAGRSDYAGQPLSVQKELAQHLTPLSAQDAYEVFHETGSVPAALAGYGIGATGIGVQSYGPSNTEAPKTSEDLRNAFTQNVRQYFHRGLTPEIDKALRLRQVREAYLEKTVGKRPGRGASEEDKQQYALKRYNAQVDLMLKRGMIDRAQARHAKSWARRRDRHVLTSRTSELGHKYFGGDVLGSAAKKIRERGGKLWLSDY